jgi:hypothetical protein
MNRSILIVICDFLLLSLLTFSTDINRMAGDETQRSARTDVVTNAVVQPGKDLMALMNQALADERQGRTQLEQQLAAARTTAGSQQAALTRFQQENAQLEQQASGLQREYAEAQTNVENLTRQVRDSSARAQATEQKLAATESQAQQASAVAEALRQQLDQLTHTNQLVQTDQQRLASQLQLAEAERKAALDRAALLQQEVQATRAENSRLTEDFKSLATNSSQLTQEIRANRALAPNTIFNDFVNNRVRAAIFAQRTGFLGMDASKQKEGETVLATDGTNTFAICHVDDTPLTLWDPGTDWNGLTGTLTGHAGDVTIRQIAFNRDDPRVVMLPVTPSEVRQLGCKVYPISADPYKFQDAVLVGADDGYYGECDFQIDLNTPHYVKLDVNLIKGLFGKFNPSRGDVVFSRTGELLGIMVNSTYCLTLHDLTAGTALAFGRDVRRENTGSTLGRLYDDLLRLQPGLQ